MKIKHGRSRQILKTKVDKLKVAWIKKYTFIIFDLFFKVFMIFNNYCFKYLNSKHNCFHL